MRSSFSPAILLATIVALTACSPSRESASDNGVASEARGNDAPAATIPMVVTGADGASHLFDMEVARTPAEQEKGLMFRKVLAADGGMIFPMDPPRTASFWMKDTLIPLDMLFIHTDGSIAFLVANVEPYSRVPVSAGVPVAAVVELRGGRAAELGIHEGDRVRWGGCAVPQPTRATDINFCPDIAR